MTITESLRAFASITNAAVAGDRGIVLVDRAMSIIHDVAQWWRVTVADLLGPSRLVHASAARQFAMYLVRRLTTLSFPAIGRMFDRDHSTVVHACQVVERRMAGSREVRFMVGEFLERHQSGMPRAALQSPAEPSSEPPAALLPPQASAGL